MSTTDTFLAPVVVLNCPRSAKEFITYARGVLIALQDNANFPSPPLSFDVFAADIGALEEAETKAATRAKGAATFRDAKLAKVKDDLAQHRTYVQTVVLASASSIDAAAVVESANMSLRKATTRNVPEISVKSADVSGKVVLTAKSLGPTAVYSWEYSLDQATWTSIPETRKARTEVSGLQSACTYSFRYRASTRAGQKDYSQVVSFLVR